MKAKLASSLLFVLLATTAWGQTITEMQRDTALGMLNQIALDVKKHYYDPSFHGLDWDSKVLETKQKVEKADSYGRALAEIESLLESLKDSHTFLLPPQPVGYHFDYGWRSQPIGDVCYVTHVRPGGDAGAKGLRAGDQLLAIDGFATNRTNFSEVEYFFSTLSPQRALRLGLRDNGGKERTIEVATHIAENGEFIKGVTHSLGGPDPFDRARRREALRQEVNPRIVEISDDLMILKLPVFFLSDAKIDAIVNKARRHKSLIVDLRENGGGAVEVLQQLVGRMFVNRVKIGDRVGRDGRSPIDGKAQGNRFEGRVIVLVDSRSASASELFARVVQIEKRGSVIGDVTAGKVMESKFYPYLPHAGAIATYGLYVTEADIVMTDGKRLEHTGVMPDEIVLPTAADLARGDDPVLARAAALAGVQLTPGDAGKLLPYEWSLL